MVGCDIMLASDLGISTIWVESDSRNVVKAINRELKYGPEIGCYLSQIWELLDSFENHLVTHLWREANKAADYLSKMRVGEDADLLLWPVDFPDMLRNIIKDDAQGKIYFRP
ncbi:hypothetical protein HRI_000029700 [Hibiscus trionum]|uniref:RNase H type-1 domain-containing protein n=1 Tax=Hibiscus trionum TaxID=183268 RepID=A0A9W7LGX5_HIBTR|nr:hypothetical protein HRI_000029700 [Hibiscus trionum]